MEQVAKNNESSPEDIENKHELTVKWIHGHTTDDDKQKMIQANNYGAFQSAVRNGQLDTAKWIYSLANESNKMAMIRARGYNAFRSALTRGHLDTAKWVYNLTAGHGKSLPSPLQHDRIPMLRYPFSIDFIDIVTNGHQKIVEWLYSISKEYTDRGMDSYRDTWHLEFCKLIKDGELESAERIYNLASESDKRYMMQADNYKAFRYAALNSLGRFYEKGRLDILRNSRNNRRLTFIKNNISSNSVNNQSSPPTSFQSSQDYLSVQPAMDSIKDLMDAMHGLEPDNHKKLDWLWQRADSEMRKDICDNNILDDKTIVRLNERHPIEEQNETTHNQVSPCRSIG